MKKSITPLERLECEARRLVKLVNEVNTDRRVMRRIRIGEVLVKEHIRRAHTRVFWTRKPGRPPIITITENRTF